METPKKVYAKRLRVWVKALRSGEYRQSRGNYHGKRGGHCCLGVAQIVAKLPMKEHCYDLRPYFGLEEDDKNKLVGLNDFGHRSFSYIADYIEKNILPRFLTN